MRMAFCSLLLAGVISASPLYADNIQMLPPTDFNGTPCNSTTGGLLQWDGQTSVKCVPGVSGDLNGNVTASGTVKPGSTNVVVGAACKQEGAFGYDSTSATHQPLYCSDKLVWTAIGSGPAGIYSKLWCGDTGMWYVDGPGWYDSSTKKFTGMLIANNYGAIHVVGVKPCRNDMSCVNHWIYDTGNVASGYLFQIQVEDLVINMEQCDLPMPPTVNTGYPTPH